MNTELVLPTETELNTELEADELESYTGIGYPYVRTAGVQENAD